MDSAQTELEQTKHHLRMARRELQKRTRQVRRLTTDLLLTEQRIRGEISQALHDELQQHLFAAQVQVQFVLQTLASGEPHPIQHDVEEVKTMLNEALRLTRQLTLELAPPTLPGLGLADMMQGLAIHMKELHALDVRLEMAEQNELLGNELPQIIFQIVRELLFNVVKHAGVHEAIVRVQRESDVMVIEVCDKGQGFEVIPDWQDSTHQTGYGLHSIARRLHLLDGEITVVSQKEMGATVTVRLPLWNDNLAEPDD